MEIKSGTSLYKARRRSVAELTVNVLMVVIIVFSAFTLLFNMRYTGVYIVNDSMLPTVVGAPAEGMPGGDFVYMDTYATPYYGDIVVIDRPKNPIIKRVIAMGGDTVKITDGRVFIKRAGEEDFGEPIDEPYVAPERNENIPDWPAENHEEGHTVKKGCIFALGDNRSVSQDSRYDGDYQLSSVQGVVPGWALKIKDFTTKLNNFFSR